MHVRPGGVDPIVTSIDGKNLKRAFGIADPLTLEKLAVYFLNHPSFREFSPSMSTFLSAGVMNGLQNRMANDPNFWHDLSQYAVAVNQNGQVNQQQVQSQVAVLRELLSKKFSVNK